jgi:hypothetical protein
VNESGVRERGTSGHDGLVHTFSVADAHREALLLEWVVLELEPVVVLLPGIPTVFELEVSVVVEVPLPLLEHCETWVGAFAAMLAFIALKVASALRLRSVAGRCPPGSRRHRNGPNPRGRSPAGSHSRPACM